MALYLRNQLGRGMELNASLHFRLSRLPNLDGIQGSEIKAKQSQQIYVDGVVEDEHIVLMLFPNRVLLQRTPDIQGLQAQIVKAVLAITVDIYVSQA